jgi:hypothetical protein
MQGLRSTSLRSMPVRGRDAAQAGKRMLQNSKCTRAFERRLAGGGFVAIEVEPIRSMWRNAGFRGRVVVERRSVQQLFAAAQSNATIAAALVRSSRGFAGAPSARAMR